MSVALVVIFNHRYDQNVEKLASRFAGRFDAVKYLVPFTKLRSPSVVGVYASSLTFSSHIAQAYTALRNNSASHYLFIGDDLLLNPAINQHNVLDFLGVKDKEAYIKNLARLEDAYYLWTYCTGVQRSFRSPGFNIWSELPTPEVAAKKLRDLNLEEKRVGLASLRHWDGHFCWQDLRHQPRFVWEWVRARSRPLPYPLVFGYSDLVLVPAAAMQQFADYCGVFGAMNLFAEVAVPTALALSCDRIRTELEIGDLFQKNSRRREGQTCYGLELWGQAAIESFETSHGRKLSALDADFPADRLYVHPIKLSRWN